MLVLVAVADPGFGPGGGPDFKSLVGVRGAEGPKEKKRAAGAKFFGGRVGLLSGGRVGLLARNLRILPTAVVSWGRQRPHPIACRQNLL